VQVTDVVSLRVFPASKFCLAIRIFVQAMKKIDWYILKKFLSTFFYSIILLTVISTVIDLSERTDDFSKSGLSGKEIFYQYYVGFIPHIMSLLFPLFVFISVIFFTSKMANLSEFIAILASGVSLQRILRPYFIGGVFLALMLWYGNLSLIPRANDIRATFDLKYLRGPMTPTFSNAYYMRVDSFTYCGMRYYDTVSKSGGNFFLQTVRNNRVVYNLRSDNILWDTAKKNWRLSSVIERHVDSLGERVTYMPEMNRTFTFRPGDLRRDDFMQARLTTPELRRMIELEKLRGSESVKDLVMEEAKRTSTPVAVIILTLIGAIMACRKIRGGSGVHLAVGILICSVFILTDRFSTIFATKGNLDPYVAAWLPNLIFGLVTIYLYKKAPK
jgi:lipopolysaccharide export system permease protein